jgi:hypothetical protein
MVVLNCEKRKRPFSSDRQIRIRQKRRFLPLLAEPFWPRSWAMELDIEAKTFYFPKTSKRTSLHDQKMNEKQEKISFQQIFSINAAKNTSSRFFFFYSL